MVPGANAGANASAAAIVPGANAGAAAIVPRANMGAAAIVPRVNAGAAESEAGAADARRCFDYDDYRARYEGSDAHGRLVADAKDRAQLGANFSLG